MLGGCTSIPPIQESLLQVISHHYKRLQINVVVVGGSTEY